MKAVVSLKHVTAVVEHLIKNGIRSVTLYVDPKFVVRATWRRKPSNRHTREEMVLTYGEPNYLEAAFVKLLKKADEPFPVRKIQQRPWPKKRKPK